MEASEKETVPIELHEPSKGGGGGGGGGWCGTQQGGLQECRQVHHPELNPGLCTVTAAVSVWVRRERAASLCLEPQNKLKDRIKHTVGKEPARFGSLLFSCLVPSPCMQIAYCSAVQLAWLQCVLTSQIPHHKRQVALIVHALVSLHVFNIWLGTPSLLGCSQ